LAFEQTKYVLFAEAVFIHLRLMKLLGEVRFGKLIVNVSST
jgi:hypothetical protein